MWDDDAHRDLVEQLAHSAGDASALPAFQQLTLADLPGARVSGAEPKD
jgi:hypothetical protein